MVIDRYRVAAILGPLLLMLPWIAHIVFNIHDSTVVSAVSCLVMLSAATLLVILYRLAQVAKSPLVHLSIQWLVILIGFVPIASIATYEWVEGIHFDCEALLLLLQTNPGEAVQFLKTRPSYVAAAVLVAVGGGLLLFCASLSEKSHQKQCVKGRLWFLFLVLVVLGGVVFSGYKQLDLYHAYKQAKHLIRTPPLGREDLVARRQNKHQKLHVVVIGESSNRTHWGLYGYERKTTPFMSSFFEHCSDCAYSAAWTSAKSTIISLKYALTDANQYHGGEPKVSIIDTLRKAGFNTVWISNQEYAQSKSRIFNLIGRSADQHLFLDEKIFSFKDDRPLDDNVVVALEKVLGSLNRDTVVFIHLMGSHAPYNLRSTEPYVKWKDPNPIGVDAYDNSILYTDKILHELMLVAREADSFIYFSDHSELPVYGRNHLHIEMFKIPFVAAFRSPTTRQKKFLANMKANMPFTNDMMYDTLLGVYGISSNYYAERYDLSSDKYAFKSEDYLMINDGKNRIINGDVGSVQ